LGRAEEATKARETLLESYPRLTVERHLANFHWKNPDDVTHYRDGLLKAGLPFNKAFAESVPRDTADS
jgi:adenylate cyclase